MYTDSHNHTCQFSGDAAMTAKELLCAARDNGLGAVVVTEHYELDYPHLLDKKLLFDVDEYFDAFSEWQKFVPPGLSLYSGIELGYQPHLAKAYDSLVSRYPFDSVILSNHLFRGKDPYFFRDCYKTPKRELYASYIGEMASMAGACSNYDIVGHYDYIARYASYEDPTVKYKDAPEEFDRLFCAIIEKNKSLELNTRSISKLQAKGISDCWPDHEIFSRYRCLGGTRVTLGSDSHDPSTVGCFFGEAAAFLKNCGFQEITTYIRREEVRTPIP